MQIIHGDITLPKTKGIIVPANACGIIGKGPLFALCDYAGPSVEQQIRSKLRKLSRPLKIGDCYTTDAGRLYRRGVTRLYYAVLSNLPNEIVTLDGVSKGLASALQTAIDEKIGSVAVPYMGQPGSHLDKTFIADRMQSVLMNYAHLIKIKVIDSDPGFIEDMKSFVKIIEEE